MTIKGNEFRLLFALALVLTIACGTTTTTPSGVATVEIRPPTSLLIQGESVQLQAQLKDAAGNLLNGRSVVWSSAAPAVASVDSDGRVTAVGSGTTVITARADGASGTASVAVQSRAVIQLDDNQVSFEATRGESDPASEVIRITNGGEAPLVDLVTSVSYLEGQSGWLSPSLSATTAPSDLTLAAAVQSLPTGTHSARLEVGSTAASNSPVPVLVTFRVLEPPPVIGLSSDLVPLFAPEMFPDPVSNTVDVSNTGGGVLDELELEVEYADGQPVGWLDASLAASIAPTQLLLSANAGTLAPGVYSATVLVSSDEATNTPQTLTVTFTVEQRAAHPLPGGSSGKGATRRP